MRKFTVLTIAGLSLLTAGCGSKGADSAAPQARKVETAQQVVDALRSGGLPITDVVIIDERTDSNNLLGRPGQYTSKVFFYDGRHPKSPEGGDEGENSVEYFASAADAKKRDDYIAQVTDGVPLLMQYRLRHGKVLVRLDKVLLPSEAKEYELALSKVLPE